MTLQKNDLSYAWRTTYQSIKVLNLTDEEIEVAPFVLPEADKKNGGANVIAIAREGCY